MSFAKALKGLTPKQRIFVERLAEGSTQIEAARAAGYGSPRAEAHRIAKHPKVQAAMDALSEDVSERMITSKLEVERMMLEAFHVAENAAEMVAAAREIGKLHGHYAPTKQAIEHTHQGKIEHDHDTRKLTHDRLLEIAGENRKLSHDDLEPIEGEYEVIDAGAS